MCGSDADDEGRWLWLLALLFVQLFDEFGADAIRITF